MAQDFDAFPVYDEISEKNGKLTPVWQDSMATFFENLIGYLTQAGILLPPLTTEQRNQILNPRNGQMIYNTTIGTAQYLKEGVWTSF